MISILPRLALVLLSTVVMAGLLVVSGDTATAAGVTFTVTKTTDTNDGTCDADCSLREAVIAANANVGEDRVQLGAGTYQLSVAGGDAEDAAQNGDLDIAGDVVIDGLGPDETIVDGDGSSTVFAVLETVSAEIRDLTIRGGGSPPATGSDTGGVISRGTLLLENVAVTENHVAGPDSTGGVSSIDADLTIRNSTITNNSTSGEDGLGGIFARGRTTIENSTISGNSAGGVEGIGGLWLVDGPVVIRDTLIANNSAPGEDGIGGLYMFSLEALLERVTISGNSVGAFGDGGMFVDESGVTMLDSAITGNGGTGEEIVGGMYAFDSDIDLLGVDISGNTVVGDRGVAGIWADDSLLDMYRTNVTNNSATGSPGTGGVYLFNTEAYMDQVDIYENTATGEFTTGGIFVDVDAINATGSLEADLTLIDSEITENEGAVGGLEVDTQVVVRLERVTIARNVGAIFGGILNDGITNLTNVTVSANSAGVDGVGGIYNPGNMFIQFSTIADNFTAGGTETVGGIWDDGDTGYLATIVAYNDPGNCIVGLGDPFSAGANIENTNSCGFDHASDQVNVPLVLELLADNGGYVETQEIPEAGHAAGNVPNCEDIATDARLWQRPLTNCDSGAYEAGAPFEPLQLIWGDNNCSNAPDPDDALLTLLYVAGLANDTGDCPQINQLVEVEEAGQHPWGDVNCDGMVDALDGLDILAWFGGFAVVPPGGCPEIGGEVRVTPLT